MAAPPNHSRTDSAAHGAIGGGLLNFRDSYASDDDDVPSKMTKSKNQALFEAAVNSKDSAAPPAYQPSPLSVRPAEKKGMMAVSNPEAGDQRSASSSPQPQQQQRMNPPQPQNRGPSPAPPAAPVNVRIQQQAAPQPQRPSPAFMPPGQGPAPPGPPGPRGHVPPPLNFQQPPKPAPGPYGVSMTPHAIPLPATSTPIQPVFIKPAFVKFEENLAAQEKEGSIMSHESTMPILRGNKEETLLARTTGTGPRLPRVGEKRDGDDFWRRFSMVAKMEKAKPANQRHSPWLRRTLGKGNSLSRWVWVVGLFLLLCIVGGSVAIWWFTRGDPDHQVPVSITGGESQAATYSSTEAAKETPKATKVDRPLITGTATFGTKLPADKRHPTPVAAAIIDQVLETTTLAPGQTVVPAGALKLHRRKINRFN
ncbi:hypothetical protein FRC03_012440 [Tulasnella sp. 419]|nr:hypothetical protein FRC03_012440 [Tulasnella sp. 419]